MKKNEIKIGLLRIVHTLFAVYFLSCLAYLYYGAIAPSFDLFLAVAFVSLAIEGFVVYVVNDGDCPLAHLQERLGDEKPFFELFFPQKIAQKAFLFFSMLTWGGVFLLLIRIIMKAL